MDYMYNNIRALLAMCNLDDIIRKFDREEISVEEAFEAGARGMFKEHNK